MSEEIDLLVVDDEPQLRELFVATFNHHGLTVKSAGNGIQALHALETFKPKVLLTDIYMPDMDGLELIMRARKICPGLKIVAISGGGNRRYGDQLESAALFGADAILGKPITRAALIEKVTSFLTPAPAAAKG